MPVAWLARVRCAAFWFRILSIPLYEERIWRVAAIEAMECGGTWIMKLQECLKSFRWWDVGAKEVRGLSSVEIKVKLEICAKRLIEDERTCELNTKPKLAALWLLKEKCIESQCLDVASKTLRRIMMMLRGGPHLRLRVNDGKSCRGRRKGVGNVNWGRFRMCPIGCCSVLCGAQNDNLSCSA